MEGRLASHAGGGRTGTGAETPDAGRARVAGLAWCKRSLSIMRIPPAAHVQAARIQGEETERVRDAIRIRGRLGASASSSTVAATPVCLATLIS